MENEYHLTEGASFRNHYNNLPQNTLIQLIQKNCYRILKIIRNSIQHNLSNVHYNSGNYDISYNYQNSRYELKMSQKGAKNLYTLVMNILNGQIKGMYKKYSTPGHYEGIMRTLYADMVKEILQLSDDIGQTLLPIPIGLNLRATGRCPVENPKILVENDASVTFRHVESNMTDDESSNMYYYSTDYMYKGYLLPQEIGIITKGQGDTLRERIKDMTIRFEKAHIEDKWKL